MVPQSCGRPTQQRDHVARERSTERLFRELMDAASSQAQRDSAREEILALHLDLCDSLAGRYATRGIERDDLVQVARLGLLNAIDRYRPERGNFVGFAIPTITGELKRHFRDHGWAVRPPRRLQELRVRYLCAEDEATQAGLGTPAEGELLDALQVDSRTLAECRNLGAAYSPLSLDRPVGDAPGAAGLGQRLWAMDDDLESLPDRLSLRQAMAGLTPRQRLIVEWRFAEECTQREIADRLGISQMQVSRLIAQVVAQLRASLDVTTEPLAS